MRIFDEAPIVEICSVISRGVTPAYDDSGILVVNQKCIRDHQVSFELARTTNPARRKVPPHKRLQLYDVLVNSTGVGTLGRVAQVTTLSCDATVDSHVTIVRPDPSKVDPRFFGYAMVGNQPRVESMGEGATGQTELSRTRLGQEISVPIPPLPVQRHISGILSAYDELIENSQRRVRILEAMARALYREWFVYFRFPDHEGHPLVASRLGEIPEGWESKRLGEIADTFRGRSYRSADLADEGGLPFLNLKCLDRDGGFRRSGLKRYTGKYKHAHVAKKGDIVMAVTDMTQERRIVARAALVPTLDDDFGIFSMDLVRIEPKPEVPKPFLYSFLRYSAFADEVKQHANGANVLHLAPERITDFHFPAPTTDLMRRFTSFVSPVLEDIDALSNKIDNLRRTRDFLLPRLLSGQIEVEAA